MWTCGLLVEFFFLCSGWTFMWRTHDDWKLIVVELRLAFYRKTYTLFHVINNDYFTKYILLVTTSSHS